MIPRQNSCKLQSVLTFLLVLWIAFCATPALADTHRRVPTDTLSHRNRTTLVTYAEHGIPSGKMMASPFPVTLHQQGRQIFAHSRTVQLLPVYTSAGAYYAAFRLNKGTNWINGLPRGTYYINGRKFIIS